MKRNELLKIIQTAMVNTSIAPLYDDLNRAALWLERLPAGCELVGFTTHRHDKLRTVYDITQPRGNPFKLPTAYVNPDDLTKTGGKR